MIEVGDNQRICSLRALLDDLEWSAAVKQYQARDRDIERANRIRQPIGVGIENLSLRRMGCVGKLSPVTPKLTRAEV